MLGDIGGDFMVEGTAVIGIIRVILTTGSNVVSYTTATTLYLQFPFKVIVSL